MIILKKKYIYIEKRREEGDGRVREEEEGGVLRVGEGVEWFL